MNRNGVLFSLMLIIVCSCCFLGACSNEEKHEHNYKSFVYKEATCIEEGVMEKLCLECGDKKYETIEKNSTHDCDWVILDEATCTEEGVKAGTCSDCNKEVILTIPKEEHEFEYGCCTKCFAKNTVATLSENEKLGFSLSEVFGIIERYGYNVDIYDFLNLFTRISAKNNTIECTYNFSGIDFSFCVENMVSDYVVDSQYNLLIDGISISKESLYIVYKDGSTIPVGYIDELFYYEDFNYEKIVKSVAINKQNQLLVVYEDNTVVLYGVVAEEISNTKPNILFMKTDNTYSCLGFLDINSKQTEINIAPSHRGEIVDSIASGAFWENKYLEKVVLSNEIKTIGDYAFSYCANLKDVDLGDSLEKIGEDAFSYCAIEEITIPISCTVISRFAFYHCQNLSKIYYEGTIEQWKEIHIEKYWKYSTPAIQIICTNGTISVN